MSPLTHFKIMGCMVSTVMAFMSYRLKACGRTTKGQPGATENAAEPARKWWFSNTSPSAIASQWKCECNHRACFRGSEIGGKQCCFKPHAVKVVYLFVTSDVTTHPCLGGGGGAAPHVTSTRPDQAEPGWAEMSPTTTRETRRAHLWLVIGGAEGKIPLSRRGPGWAGHNKKVMAIYLGSKEGEIFVVGLPQMY